MTRDQTLFFQRSGALPFVELRRADRSSACYHTHSHDEFSFGVIDRGEAAYQNRQHRHRVGAGITVTINPADAHACNPRTGCWSYRMIFIDARWVGRLQQEITGITLDYLPFPGPYEDNALTYHQFQQLFAALLAERSPLAAESLLIDFLQRRFAPQFAARRKLETRDQVGLDRVRQMIMDQLEQNLRLDQFCTASGLSRYHLIRSFKQAYGQSPHAYQLDQRIKQAKRLLQRGDSLASIASRLGFADQAHFQRHFKKRVAITPKQYQSFFLP